MKLYDLEKLIIDSNQAIGTYNSQGFSDDISTSGLSIGDSLYNLFDPTFKLNIGYSLTKYIVQKEDEMRIDLISNNIYGTADQADFLLDINDIDNPLNIMAGDELIYPDYNVISDYRVKVIDNTDVRAKLLNANKSKRIDNNRQNYIDQSYSLPPTFQDVPKSSVTIQNNQIVIGS